jgi:hypothetical protein
MGIFLGVGDAAIRQPGVHLFKTLEPQARREEALAHQPNLVLDLTFLPAGGRRAGDGLDEIMRAHLQEAAVVLALLADEDRVDRRFHVVVDAALAGALEKDEGARSQVYAGCVNSPARASNTISWLSRG